MDILDESTRQLGKLKEPLVEFFKNILTDIENNVGENLEVFLRPILQGITEGSSPEEVDAIMISRRRKEVSFNPSSLSLFKAHAGLPKTNHFLILLEDLDYRSSDARSLLCHHRYFDCVYHHLDRLVHPSRDQQIGGSIHR